MLTVTISLKFLESIFFSFASERYSHSAVAVITALTVDDLLLLTAKLFWWGKWSHERVIIIWTALIVVNK